MHAILYTKPQFSPHGKNAWLHKCVIERGGSGDVSSHDVGSKSSILECAVKENTDFCNALSDQVLYVHALFSC